MKFGHVVLFAAAASVLTYLNSVLKDEGDDDDSALRELEELTDEESQKLIEKEDLDQTIEDDISDISESLRYIGSSLLDEIFDHQDEDEAVRINKEDFKDEEVKEEVEEDKEKDSTDLISDIEELLKELDAETNERSVIDDFDEDSYFKEIQDAINKTIALDEEGEKVDLAELLKEEDTKDISEDEIDEIFKEILDQEGLRAEIKDEEEKADKEDEYLATLADELKDALETDEVEDEQEDVYTKIGELYPYLSPNFIKAVYDLKGTLASEYPLDYDVVVLHRLSFTDLEDLRQFIEIVLDHDYQINVDEDKMIVDVFKEFKNEDGKILANIYEIANQAKVLNGNYEGYRVEILI